MQVKPVANEMALLKALVKIGPLSVTIDASGLQNISSRSDFVYASTKCSTAATEHAHCVLLVGYGTTDKGEDYWLVKNSWGPGWGDQGYFKLARNRGNMCGIANWALYP